MNIYIFGASCGGKSTLAQALQRDLGPSWTYLDRDLLIENENCSEDAADITLDERVKSIGHNVIVDAQIPWREKRENEFYFLVLPPLTTLLERDTKRTRNLKRSPAQAEKCELYVRETFETLSQTSIKFDYRFDSSKVTVQNEIQTIRSIIYPPKPNIPSKYFPIAIVGLVVCILFSKILVKDVF